MEFEIGEGTRVLCEENEYSGISSSVGEKTQQDKLTFQLGGVWEE